MKPRAVIFLALLMGSFRVGYACTCLPVRYPSLQEEVAAAANEAAFIGIVRITSVRRIKEVHDLKGRYVGLRDADAPPAIEESPGNFTYLVASFEVLHAWKQEKHLVMKVKTGLGISDCGIGFKPGQIVLLYASPPDYTGLMSTGQCDRTNLARRDKTDIPILNRKYKRVPAPGLY